MRASPYSRSFLLVLFFALVLFSPFASAQIANITGSTSTPVQGQGHDYIQMFNETVNPANGTLSIRINLPVRKQLGVTLPSSIVYESTGMRHIGRWPDTAPGVLQWIPDLTPFHENGWSLTNASLTNYRGVRVYQPLDHPYFQCFYFTDYVFHDPSGEAHPLQSTGYLRRPTVPAFSLPCSRLWQARMATSLLKQTYPSPNLS